jgi:hypothetical protein
MLIERLTLREVGPGDTALLVELRTADTAEISRVRHGHHRRDTEPRPMIVSHPRGAVLRPSGPTLRNPSAW